MRQTRGPETGGPLPRAAHAGNSGAVAFGGLVLLVISPAAFIAAVLTVRAVIGQLRRHWWEWALVAFGLALVVGVVMQLVTGNVLAAQFGGYASAINAGGSWVAAVAHTLPLGIPLGVAAGAAYVGL